MKIRSTLFVFLLVIFASLKVNATHTLNYYYSYKVLDKTAQTFKIQLDINIYMECVYNNPNSTQSDLMLGIYDPVSKTKVKEVQISYISTEILEDLSQASKNGCFAQADYSAIIELPHNINNSGYLFQLNTCCYANFYRNINMNATPGVFHEFTVPSGLDIGFSSASQKYNTIFPIRSKTSALLSFAENPGDFDSVRYALMPAYEDPQVRSYTAWYVSDTAYKVDTMAYYQGYTWDRPLGININYQFSDTGSLLVGRNFNFGFHQIALKAAYYLDGQPYYGTRYITAMVTYQLDPKLYIKGALLDSTKTIIESNLLEFDAFQNANLLRSQVKTGSYSTIASISNGNQFTIDSTINYGEGYYYQLQGINSIDTFYSDTFFIQSKSIRPSLTVQIDQLNKEWLRLKWTPKEVPYTAMYLLERATDSLGPYLSLNNSLDTFFTDTSVNPGTTYFYKLSTSFGSNSLVIIQKIKTPGWALGIENNLSSIASIYPNPATNYLKLDLVENERIEIINPQGQIFYQGNFEPGLNTLDIHFLKSGLYFIRTKSGNQRFIKQD